MRNFTAMSTLLFQKFLTFGFRFQSVGLYRYVCQEHIILCAKFAVDNEKMKCLWWMLMMQALEKADEAKNAADKSVEIISTTMTTIDDILGQISEYNNYC